MGLTCQLRAATVLTQRYVIVRFAYFTLDLLFENVTSKLNGEEFHMVSI